MGHQLTVPVHFFAPDGFLVPELERPELFTAPEGPPERLRRALDMLAVGPWVLRSFLELHAAGAPVTISNTPRPGAINITDGYNLGRKRRVSETFFCIARADGHLPELANFILQQNEQFPEHATSSNLPNWPQLGLLPRDPSRGERLERLTYKGLVTNLDPAFRSPGLVAELRALGVAFDVTESDDCAALSTEWRDYRACDAVVAVRNLTVADSRTKPASKLVNAWLAGVPAFLGPEPAFLELRRSPLDFFELRRPEDLLAGIARLRNEPGLYRAMVENGLRRAPEFSPERIRARWLEVLAGPVTEAFHRWQRTPRPLRWLQILGMLRREPAARQGHVARALAGPRILDADAPAAAAAGSGA